MPNIDAAAARRQAANNLFRDALELGARGETQQALAVLEQVVHRIGDDPDSRNLLAAVMFNKGIVFRFAGETGAAVAALDAVVERFGGERSEELNGWVALALYNKGFVLEDANRLPEALDAFEAFLRRFGESTSPEIRERVANAMYRKGLLLQALGQADRARQAFTDILYRFGDAAEPAIQQLIAVLIGDELGHLDFTTPARHAESDRMNLETEAFLEERSRQHPEYAEAIEREIRERREWVREEAELASARHAEALKIFTAYRENLEPYALFLRNFEIEAHQAVGMGPEGPQRVISTKGTEQGIEVRLAAALRERLPLLGIENPLSMHSFFQQHAIPKLELRNETWRAAVQELVAGASLIVFNLTDLSPGVALELQTIFSHEKQSSTVVILSIDEGEPDGSVEGVRQYLNIPSPPRQSLEQIRSQLSGFPRVVLERDINFDDLDASPAFADLLKQANFIRTLSKEQRQARKEIERLNRSAQAGMSRGSWDGVVALLERAVSLNKAVGDAPLSLVTHSRLGVAYGYENRYTEALGAFTEALRLSREAGDVTSEGLFLRDLGDCRRALGEYPEAIQRYREAVPLLETRDPEGHIDTLQKLGGAYSDADDPDHAAACFDEAFGLYRKAGDLSGMLQVRMQLGLAYFHATRYGESIESFEEAVTLARQLRAQDAEEASLKAIERARALSRQ